MWIWILVFLLFIVLLIVLEEAGYYLFNQYLYGTNFGKQLKWKKRMMTLLTLIKKTYKSTYIKRRKKRVHKEISKDEVTVFNGKDIKNNKIVNVRKTK